MDHLPFVLRYSVRSFGQTATMAPLRYTVRVIVSLCILPQVVLAHGAVPLLHNYKSLVWQQWIYGEPTLTQLGPTY